MNRVMNEKGIIFIDGASIIKDVVPSKLLIENEEVNRYLYPLHMLPTFLYDGLNIADLWECLQVAEQDFYGLEESTIVNPVSGAINNFYNAAFADKDIDNKVIDYIYNDASESEIIERLDKVEDENIKTLYQEVVNQNDLYEKFCFQRNILLQHL